jgi:cysteine sulfinate desulfinase/cysteine desulfurase-like protein
MMNRGSIIGVGSACSKGKPSKVLSAMRLPHVVRAGYVRISLYDGMEWSSLHKFIKSMLVCIDEQM